MKGLELSKSFFEEYGLPMLERDFGDKIDRIAVGLVGHGSECFGYDDDISIDHDYDANFCFWLTEEDERDFGFRLFRAYSKLPKEYNGIKLVEKSIGGNDAKGVKTIKDFYSFYTGNGELPTTLEHWLSIPDFYLAEATNGEVFMDKLGEFSRMREGLRNRPNDVRLKKLASSVFTMAQTGQYNYLRCLSHGEKGAAVITLSDFARSTAQAIYLLNNRYAPYYKWIFRGLKELPILGDLHESIEGLLSDPLNQKTNSIVIDCIAERIEEQIRIEGLSSRTETYLEPYAYCITNNIKDSNLRNMPIML